MEFSCVIIWRPFSTCLERCLYSFSLPNIWKLCSLNQLHSPTSFRVSHILHRACARFYTKTHFLILSCGAHAGTVGLACAAVGILLSGVVLSKYKPRARVLAAWNIFCGVVLVSGVVAFAFLECSNSLNEKTFRNLKQVVQSVLCTYFTHIRKKAGSNFRLSIHLCAQKRERVQRGL